MSEPKPDITSLGSEMLTWSDLEAVGGFDGPAVATLVSGLARRPHRLLVVGPTTPVVVEALGAEADHVEVLTRSWPDAQVLRDRLADDVRVHCGPLDLMSRAGHTYDAVVALDGIDRLHTAEEPAPSWTAVISDLAGLLGPAGELLLTVDNRVGVDRLVALPPIGREHDASWPQGHPSGPQPASAGDVLGRLSADHALVEVETWSCHGPRSRPRLVTSSGVLTGRASDALVLRLVAAAYAAPDTSPAAVLRDPGVVAAELVTASLGDATAPGTVLHVRRGAPAGGVDGVPAMIVHEAGDDDGSPVICRYELAGDRWIRRLSVPAGHHQVAPGLVRDTGRLDGEVPPGRDVGSELRDLLAQFDVSAAAQLVRRVRDWIGAAEGEVQDPQRVAVSLDRLVVGDGTLRLVDESYGATLGADRDTVLVRALLRCSYDLVAKGARHPWSEAATPRVLATSLAAAADLRLDDDAYARAVSLDRALQDPRASTPDYEAAFVTGDDATVIPYAELLELSRALAERVAMQDAHVVWLLDAVQRRQRRLRRLRGTVAELTRSPEYRLGRRVLWLRDLVRRRRHAREKRQKAPPGVWRDRSDEPPVEDTTIYVEQDLVPPGYQPHDGVVMTPTGVDPGADDES